MSSLNRRRFLKITTALAAATALRAQAAHAVEPTGFKIFACDWTLRKGCDPASFALAKQIGLDGVQVDFGRVTDPRQHPPLFAEAHQDRILVASAEHGVPIASLAMGVLNSVALKSEAAAQQWLLDSVAVATRLRQRLVLLAFFNQGDLVDDPAGTEEVIRQLKRLAPRAENAGIVYGIESWLKAPVLERILDQVSSPAIRVYYDVGNMQKVGEDIGPAIRRLGRERICEIHLKDYDDLYGKGSMNFPAVREALDAIRYRGWLGIEGTKLPLGVEQSIRYNLDYLRTIFPRNA